MGVPLPLLPHYSLLSPVTNCALFQTPSMVTLLLRTLPTTSSAPRALTTVCFSDPHSPSPLLILLQFCYMCCQYSVTPDLNPHFGLCSCHFICHKIFFPDAFVWFLSSLISFSSLQYHLVHVLFTLHPSAKALPSSLSNTALLFLEY